MIRGIERLARDMTAKVFKQEVVANNLANATTPGFKTQRSFVSMLKGMITGTGTQAGPVVDTYSSFEQGPIEHTHRSLDLALDGEGFFAIATPVGERYTRSGSFTLTEAGLLATQTGGTVAGTGGPMAIEGGQITVGRDGTVVVDGEEVGMIRVVTFADPQALIREGNMYASSGQAAREVDFTETAVIQGALERSNVNPIDEMVEMIALHRNFEAAQRGIRLQDESAKQAIERVGQFG